MFAAQSLIQSLSLGLEEKWGGGLTFLPLTTFLRDQHTLSHSIPQPLGPLLLGQEDCCSLSLTCSCR